MKKAGKIRALKAALINGQKFDFFNFLRCALLLKNLKDNMIIINSGVAKNNFFLPVEYFFYDILLKIEFMEEKSV